MILRLRNRHRYTWFILALLLPLVFLAALSARPADSLPPNAKKVPVVKERQAVASTTAEGWEAVIYRTADGSAWLEANLTAPSQRPVSTIYLAQTPAAGIAKATPIGAVGSQGIHTFPLDSLTATWPNFYLFFYDQLNQQTYAETQLIKSR